MEETSHRHTGELESTLGVRDDAQAGVPDRDHCIGDWRTALGIFDHAGHNASLVRVHRRRKREGVDEDETENAAK